MHRLHYVNSANGSAQRDSFWTEDRVAKLKTLWAGGGVAADFAVALGTTRKAVIGKARRLKLGRLRADGFRLFEIRSHAAKKSWREHYPTMIANLAKANAARLAKFAD